MTTYAFSHQPLSWFNNGWKSELLFFPHILQTKQKNLIDCYWLSFVSRLYILRQIKNEHIIDIHVPQWIVSLITLNWNFVSTTQIASYRQLLILYVTSILPYVWIAHVRYYQNSDSEAFWSFCYIWFGLVFFVLKSPLGIARQWTLKPWSHVWILIYWTWAIKG